MNEKHSSGYANYQTWNVALHLGNDYNAYLYWQERAKMIKDVIENGDCDNVEVGIWTAEQAAKFLLADELEADMKDTHPLVHQASMYSDLLTHSLGRVDWYEVADSVLAE